MALGVPKEVKNISKTINWLERAYRRTTDGRVENVIDDAIYALANISILIQDEHEMNAYHSTNERMSLRARA